MYGALRGIQQHELPPIVDDLIGRLGLQQYADRPCEGYSGGNKRKLSTAIALIGDAPVVFLDEPTTVLSLYLLLCAVISLPHCLILQTVSLFLFDCFRKRLCCDC